MEFSVVKLESFVKQEPDDDAFESESMAHIRECEIEKTSYIDAELDPLKIQLQSKKCYKEAKFQCSFCTNVYSTYKSLRDHIRLKHREKKLEVKHTCPIAKCDRTFPTKLECVIHISDAHAPNHQVDDKDGKFHCPFCPKSFSQLETLYYHSTSEHAADEKKHFECQICKDEQKCSKFFDQVCLNKHISVVHKPFKCPICFLSFGSSNFKKHKDTHLGEKKFQCDYCPEIFSQKPTLKFHLVKKHKDKSVKVKMTIYKCELCDKVFKANSLLTRHAVNVHQVVEKVFECSICCRKFFHEGYLAEHVKRMHKKNPKTPHVCRLCSQEFTTRIDYERHLGVEHGIFFDCRKCSLLFKTKREFDEHLKVVSDSPLLRCQICRMNLKNRCCLDIHEYSHLKQLESKPQEFFREGLRKGLICQPVETSLLTKVVVKVEDKQEKSKKFDQQDPLVNHERLHSKIDNSNDLYSYTMVDDESKHLNCGLCHRNFLTNLQLKSHMAICHGGEKPFKCRLCPRTFVYKSQLDSHSSFHSNQRPFFCDKCANSYKSLRDLKKHKRDVHRLGKLKLGSARDAFACALCSFETKDERELAIHNNIHNLPKVTVRKIVLCVEHEFQITGTWIKQENEAVSTSKEKCPLC